MFQCFDPNAFCAHSCTYLIIQIISTQSVNSSNTNTMYTSINVAILNTLHKKWLQCKKFIAIQLLQPEARNFYFPYAYSTYQKHIFKQFNKRIKRNAVNILKRNESKTLYRPCINHHFTTKVFKPTIIRKICSCVPGANMENTAVSVSVKRGVSPI